MPFITLFSFKPQDPLADTKHLN